jgi:hypothetical protein
MTPPPQSPALMRRVLLSGPGWQVMVTMYELSERYTQPTTRQIAGQTDYQVATVRLRLRQARALGYVDLKYTPGVPPVPYWRLTVLGREFVQREQAARR